MSIRVRVGGWVKFIYFYAVFLMYHRLGYELDMFRIIWLRIGLGYELGLFSIRVRVGGWVKFIYFYAVFQYVCMYVCRLKP